jgi:hypothetical protein
MIYEKFYDYLPTGLRRAISIRKRNGLSQHAMPFALKITISTLEEKKVSISMQCLLDSEQQYQFGKEMASVNMHCILNSEEQNQHWKRKKSLSTYNAFWTQKSKQDQFGKEMASVNMQCLLKSKEQHQYWNI